MSIIEDVESGKPLAQGDVLHEITLFTTCKTWDDPEPAVADFPACLVISRNCAVENDNHALVCAIERCDPFKELDSKADFAKAVRTLAEVRDGHGFIDILYLGAIPLLSPGRFRVRFNSIHTIELPREQVRQTFVDSKRVGRLHPEYLRDFHIKFFRAVASEGFDSFAWLDTSDLNMLVKIGDSKIASLEAELIELEFQCLKHDSKKGQPNPGLEKQIEKKKQALERLRLEVNPYREELQSRN